MKKLLASFLSVIFLVTVLFTGNVIASEEVSTPDVTNPVNEIVDNNVSIPVDESDTYDVSSEINETYSSETILNSLGDFVNKSDEEGLLLEIPHVTIYNGETVQTYTKDEYENLSSRSSLSAVSSVAWNVVLNTTGGKFEYGYKIMSVTGTKPSSMKITVSPQIANYRSGPFSQFGSADFSLKSSDIFIGKTGTKLDQIYSTKYWKFHLSSEATWTGAPYKEVWSSYGDNYIILLNKKGVEYPKYTDPQSGIKLWEPPANLAVNTRSPGNYRGPFETWYNNNFGQPTRFSWSDVQIHHMQPLKYNGSDSVSNLIPLWKPGSTPKNGIMSHTVLNNWWLQY
ncbi:hypothetical protein AMS62_03045 [Bacillus sp. FJAT-18019]|nr:hypothetical protein AMS62_03045 [Bacillus sp. FJAT-18019]